MKTALTSTFVVVCVVAATSSAIAAPKPAPYAKPLGTLTTTVARAPRMIPAAVTVDGHTALIWVTETGKLELAELTADGRLPAKPTELLPTKVEREDLHVASDGHCIGMAWIAEHSEADREVVFARWCPTTGVSTPTSLAHLRATNVAIAAGANGRFAVAWFKEDPSDRSDFELSVIGATGAIESTAPAEREPMFIDASYGHMSIIAVDDGWLAIVDVFSLGKYMALDAVRLDARGRRVAYGELLRGKHIDSPIVVRDGDHAVVAFGWGRDLALMPVALDGSALGPAVTLATFGTSGADLIGSGLDPSAVRRVDDRWWIAYDRHDGQSIAFGRHEGPDHDTTHVITTDGVRASAPIEVGDRGRHQVGISLAAGRAGMLASVVSNPWSGHDRVETYALGQAPDLTTTLASISMTAATSTTAVAATSCDVRTSGKPIHRYEPVRFIFDLAAIGSASGADLAIGWSRHPTRGVSRMARDGTVRWTRDVSQQLGLAPAIAVGADAIAAVWDDGDTLQLATFALDGTPRVAPHQIGASTEGTCIAALADGWAVVAADMGGSRYLRIAADGSARPAVAAPAATTCGLAPTPGGTGVMLAMSRLTPAKDTHFLYTQRLDGNGRAVGAEQVVEQLFAESPVLAPLPTGYVLAWSDPTLVDTGYAFRAVVLDAAGAPTSVPIPFGWNLDGYGMGLVIDSTGPVLIHANANNWVEQPLCPDHPNPPPPRIMRAR